MQLLQLKTFINIVSFKKEQLAGFFSIKSYLSYQ